MATSTSAEMQSEMQKPKGASVQAIARVAKHRRISPQAGHALEILGHAIDYLTDEYVYAGGAFSVRDSQLEAIHLLMALNRQIYFECPEVPSLAERCRSLLHLRTA